MKKEMSSLSAPVPTPETTVVSPEEGESNSQASKEKRRRIMKKQAQGAVVSVAPVGTEERFLALEE